MTATYPVWAIILILAVGTFLIRFSFLGIVGDRPLPPWVLRHLRYTAVAVLPGLVAPLVFFPSATGGTPDVPRLAAAALALAVGYWRGSFVAGFAAGAVGFYSVSALSPW